MNQLVKLKNEIILKDRELVVQNLQKKATDIVRMYILDFPNSGIVKPEEQIKEFMLRWVEAGIPAEYFKRLYRQAYRECSEEQFFSLQRMLQIWKRPTCFVRSLFDGEGDDFYREFDLYSVTCETCKDTGLYVTYRKKSDGEVAICSGCFEKVQAAGSFTAMLEARKEARIELIESRREDFEKQILSERMFPYQKEIDNRRQVSSFRQLNPEEVEMFEKLEEKINQIPTTLKKVARDEVDFYIEEIRSSPVSRRVKIKI